MEFYLFVLHACALGVDVPVTDYFNNRVSDNAQHCASSTSCSFFFSRFCSVSTFWKTIIDESEILENSWLTLCVRFLLRCCVKSLVRVCFSPSYWDRWLRFSADGNYELRREREREGESEKEISNDRTLIRFFGLRTLLRDPTCLEAIIVFITVIVIIIRTDVCTTLVSSPQPALPRYRLNLYGPRWHSYRDRCEPRTTDSLISSLSQTQAPEGETQPSTEVDLFISTEKIMVLNTDLKEIMMDHTLRTISYIADIGDLVVLMARRRPGEIDGTFRPLVLHFSYSSKQVLYSRRCISVKCGLYIWCR